MKQTKLEFVNGNLKKMSLQNNRNNPLASKISDIEVVIDKENVTDNAKQIEQNVAPQNNPVPIKQKEAANKLARKTKLADWSAAIHFQEIDIIDEQHFYRTALNHDFLISHQKFIDGPQPFSAQMLYLALNYSGDMELKFLHQIHFSLVKSIFSAIANSRLLQKDIVDSHKVVLPMVIKQFLTSDNFFEEFLQFSWVEVLMLLAQLNDCTQPETKIICSANNRELIKEMCESLQTNTYTSRSFESKLKFLSILVEQAKLSPLFVKYIEQCIVNEQKLESQLIDLNVDLKQLQNDSNEQHLKSKMCILAIQSINQAVAITAESKPKSNDIGPVNANTNANDNVNANNNQNQTQYQNNKMQRQMMIDLETHQANLVKIQKQETELAQQIQKMMSTIRNIKLQIKMAVNTFKFLGIDKHSNEYYFFHHINNGLYVKTTSHKATGNDDVIVWSHVKSLKDIQNIVTMLKTNEQFLEQEIKDLISLQAFDFDSEEPAATNRILMISQQFLQHGNQINEANRYNPKCLLDSHFEAAKAKCSNGGDQKKGKLLQKIANEQNQSMWSELSIGVFCDLLLSLEEDYSAFLANINQRWADAPTRAGFRQSVLKLKEEASSNSDLNLFAKQLAQFKDMLCLCVTAFQNKEKLESTTLEKNYCSFAEMEADLQNLTIVPAPFRLCFNLIIGSKTFLGAVHSHSINSTHQLQQDEGYNSSSSEFASVIENSTSLSQLNLALYVFNGFVKYYIRSFSKYANSAQKREDGRQRHREEYNDIYCKKANKMSKVRTDNGSADNGDEDMILRELDFQKYQFNSKAGKQLLRNNKDSDKAKDKGKDTSKNYNRNDYNVDQNGNRRSRRNITLKQQKYDFSDSDSEMEYEWDSDSMSASKEELHDNSIACQVCNSEKGYMMNCGGCSKLFHSTCVNRKEKPDEHNFRCDTCEKSKNQRQTRSKANNGIKNRH